ncbi:hypothetical protein WJX72_000232 [[Myrmecia] bisecta]|uniref:RING-type E3 ubiquitin transferase n=1 Tax=[Myrmecia] bisecta TaxID=41462 RepID=A0AAW1QNL6_9CHLO
MQSSAFDLLEQLSDDEGELLVAKTAALAAKATAAKASSKPLPKPAKAKPVMSKAPAPPPTQPAKYAPGVTPPPPGWTPRKMCKYYEQHGACGLGKLCWYAHHRSELTKEKPKAVVPAKVQMPTSTMNNVPGFLYKTQMCAYHPLGRCLKGNDCSYAHSQAELRKHQGHGRESKLSAAPPAPVPQSRPSAETYAQQFPAAFGFVASSSSSMEAAQKPIASLPRPQPSTQALSLEPSEAVREEIDLPDMLVCPITQEVFKDPVVAADGFTYERAAITDWLRKSLTSPMTNEALPHDKVVPNFSIRQTISSCLGR